MTDPKDANTNPEEALLDALRAPDTVLNELASRLGGAYLGWRQTIHIQGLDIVISAIGGVFLVAIQIPYEYTGVFDYMPEALDRVFHLPTLNTRVDLLPLYTYMTQGLPGRWLYGTYKPSHTSFWVPGYSSDLLRLLVMQVDVGELENDLRVLISEARVKIAIMRWSCGRLV